MKKIVFIFGIIGTIIACAGQKPQIDTASLYKTHCRICHGIDGKLGINGAKDLTQSKMTLDERINNITNGKGTMTAFKGLLSKDEIKALAEYTFTLND